MQKVILPFVSGFLAALFFREATLALLHAAGVIDPAGYSTAPFLPLGIPEFIANALWSSVFGVLMAWLLRIAPDRSAPWIGALVFGGIVLTAASVFVVGPARGIWPSGNMLPRLAIGFVTNAMWGWGALVFMRAFMAETAGERARDNRSGRRAP
ncbi:membrane protein [Caballeronia arationis]|jgi:hypothetical protein|uniref:Transmembrane protein n=1 Tax=Caballeronia arationis TaxID=1777142 RepID=A0A7Z7I946_9BURK|nr:hypothetical protein [Caballeronia arationis]SAK76006.1 membrane protein [Caballeronia arationis]SOE81578.1 hypothetical protein SAMN05446927_4865 [Caballeronia arationis]